MKRNITSVLVASTLVVLATSTTAMASSKNGVPFAALWDAIADLQQQIDNIELIEGPQGPAGPQGEPGESGEGGAVVLGIYRVDGAVQIPPTATDDGWWIAEAWCDHGDQLVTHGYDVNKPGLFVSHSFPVYENWIGDAGYRQGARTKVNNEAPNENTVQTRLITTVWCQDVGEDSGRFYINLPDTTSYEPPQPPPPGGDEGGDLPE